MRCGCLFSFFLWRVSVEIPAKTARCEPSQSLLSYWNARALLGGGASFLRESGMHVINMELIKVHAEPLSEIASIYPRASSELEVTQLQLPRRRTRLSELKNSHVGIGGTLLA